MRHLGQLRENIAIGKVAARHADIYNGLSKLGRSCRLLTRQIYPQVVPDYAPCKLPSLAEY